MQTNKTYFSLPVNLTLEFSSDYAELSNDAKLILRAYVPGINELKTKPDEIDIVFEHRNSKIFKLELGARVITLFAPWGDELISDIYHLIYAVVRRYFLEKNLFSVHGACVEKNGKCILILGHSGSGKTAVALKLAEEHGMQVVSGNKTVVAFKNSEIQVVAGTTAMSILEQDKKVINVSGGLDYKNRHIFEINHKNMISPIEIGAITIVRLNDYTQESNKLELPDTLHALYPYFLDVVNADVIVGDKVFVGTPPSKSQELLIAGLKKFNSPVYSYIGSASFVANNISRL